MNRQVNPDHCYETEEGVVYMLEPAHGHARVARPEGRAPSPDSFTSLSAAKGWLEHVFGVADVDRNFGLTERYEHSRYRSAMIDAGRGRLLK